MVPKVVSSCISFIFMHLCILDTIVKHSYYDNKNWRNISQKGRISIKRENSSELVSTHFGILLHQTLHTDEMARTNFSDWTKWKRVSRCLTNHEVIFVQVIYTTKSGSLGILNILRFYCLEYHFYKNKANRSEPRRTKMIWIPIKNSFRKSCVALFLTSTFLFNMAVSFTISEIQGNLPGFNTCMV